MSDDEFRIDYLKLNPVEWSHWFKNEWLPKNTPHSNHKYFITFTYNGNGTIEDWKKRIRFELSRKFVMSFKLCIEHEDTNIHAHVILESNKYLRKERHFATFIKQYGYVDLKKVQYDNGLEQYISKEGEIIESLEKIV